MNARLFFTIAAWSFALSLRAASSLASPCPPDSGESNLHRGPDGTLYLTWSGAGVREGERALQLATLAPGATAWTAPRSIVSTERLMENWADFASLVVASDGALWAQWFQSREESSGHGYDGWFARSTDGGKSWSPPASLGHEFVSLAPLSGGRVLAVWLESTRRGGGGHDHDMPSVDTNQPYRPAMQLKARLLGPDTATLGEWLVDPDVCNCCQTTLASLPGDRVQVIYRGHDRAELRDHRISLFDGKSWSAPRAFHEDGWKIAACPVNGPAADAAGQTVTAAWFTAANGIARVQAKVSHDAGHSFGPAVPLDLGRPIGRIDLVALPDGSSVVSWLEAAHDQHVAGLYVRRLFPDGRRSIPLLLTETSAVRASGFPRLATRPGKNLDVVVSWTDAVPADPTNPKSSAATHVRVRQFSAVGLTPEAKTAAPSATPAATITVIRRESIVFLETCSR